jgi:uncharacterized protein (TIGR02444 family)
MTEPQPTPSSSGSPFWRFSLQFYRQPGVAEACIALQEGSGVDVNLLLFLLWHAAQGRRLSAPQVRELDRSIGPWRDMTVIPLRTLRRALKSPPGLVQGAAAEAFRTRIKAVELEAERLQQEAMHEFARAGLLGEAVPSAADAARANVAAYESLCGSAFTASAVDTLLAALAQPRDSKD